MPLNLNKVHNYEKVQGRNQVVLRGVTPYVRFVHKEETPVIIQNGTFYSDGGQRINKKDVPQWVWDQAALVTKKKRDIVGLLLPGEKADKKKDTEKEEADILVDQILGEVDEAVETSR